MKIIFRVWFLLAVLSTGFLADNIFAASGDTRVCYWKDSKVGAISLQFDDSLASHASFVVPNLISRGLTGHFFINTGTTRYSLGIMTWEALANRYNIGLGNHSFNHRGTVLTTFDTVLSVVADHEVGENARRIWSLNPPGRSKFAMFLGGGGTTWTGANWGTLYSDYHIAVGQTRGTNPGIEQSLAVSRTGYNAATAANMIYLANQALVVSSPVIIAFHGTGYDPEYQSNGLCMWASEWLPAVDHIASIKDRVWVGTADDIQKYKDERDSAVASGITAGATSISMNLTSSESVIDYDYPLTLITEVPATWNYAKVTQGSISAKKTYAVDVWVSSRTVMFDAVPGFGTITLDSVAGADASAPGNPVVSDGLGADLDVTTHTDHVDANWTASTDADSGIKKYWYRVGVTPGGAELLDWIDNGIFTYVSTRRTHIALSKGVTYYFTVKAENGDGLFSSAVASDGILVSRSANDVLFSDDFETGNTSKWSAGSNGANTLAVNTEAAYRGTYGLKVHIAGTNTVALSKSNFGAIDDNFVRFNFKLSSDFTMPEVYASTEPKLMSIMTLRDASNVLVGSVYLCNTKGSISLYSQFVDDDDWQWIPWGPGSGAGYIPVTKGVWHSVDFHTRALAKEVGGVEFWLDGVKVCAAMNRSMTNKGARTVNLGIVTIGQNISGDIYIDDLVCSDNLYHLSVLSGASADTTPPTPPSAVRDGTGTDIGTILSTGQLSANWDAGTDTDSGISGYQYAIGTTPGGSNTAGWAALGNVLTVSRSGLTVLAGTTYYFSVKSVNGYGLPSASATNSNGQCVEGGTPPDTTGPAISVVSAQNVTTSAAEIIWTTDELSTTRVEYGLTAAYGQTTAEDSSPVTSHSAALSGLTAGTVYHYRVISRDPSSNESVSTDNTFTTTGLPAAINTSANAYPNPVTLSSGQQAKFRITGASGGEVSIYTLSGRKVRNITAGAGATDASWDLCNSGGEKIKAGLYVYKIADAGGTRSGKIVLTR
ncbi:MAG: hypothetical protein A2297_04465 [Elusimicrobia bacterium RIFOXYB2_FULL_48_7]|nr:MAG: hypothetical protein A2297_04465 [Elusimicrobia bacterium RIFOXYB2_FULL_48_7]